MKISMKLVYQYMTIFFNFLPTSNHLHLLQVENCGSNSRLVVDEDDNGKLRLERVNRFPAKLSYLNVYKLELPQLKVGENYSYLFLICDQTFADLDV